MTDLDCDGAGVYVVPNVFNPRDLVSRPDNMDTLYHTYSLKLQKRSHRKTCYAISDKLPYLSNTQFHKCKLDGEIAT